VRRSAVEAAALKGLSERVMAPEAVAADVRAYHAAWAEEATTRQDRRRPIERKIAELGRALDRTVKMIIEGRATRAQEDLALKLEREKDALEAQLTAWDAEEGRLEPVTLHPSAGGAYAALVGRLHGELAAAALNPQDPADRELVEAIRGLVTRTTIHPKGDRSDTLAFDLVLQRDLAHFMAAPGTKVAGAATPGIAW
jgi:hypothetical protein